MNSRLFGNRWLMSAFPPGAASVSFARSRRGKDYAESVGQLVRMLKFEAGVTASIGFDIKRRSVKFLGLSFHMNSK